MENTTRDFKIIGLCENTEKNSELEILIAILSPSKILISNNKEYYFSELNKEKVFVMPLNSSLAIEMKKFPSEIISFDIHEFKIQKIALDDVCNDFGFIHNDILNEKEKINIPSEIIEDKITNSLTECLLEHHVEMFFSIMFKNVLTKEFLQNKIEHSDIDLPEVFKLYHKIMAVFLMEICSVINDEYKSLEVNFINLIKEKYSDAINYGGSYRGAIANYVINTPETYQTSLNILKDNRYEYSGYIQRSINIGYNTALTRMFENLEGEEYFSHEMIISKSKCVIKLYPTPYAYLNFNVIVELIKSGKMNDEIDDYFLKNNIIRIKDEDLIAELKTTFIFSHNEISGVFYYKRRELNLNNISFGQQDRKNPFAALFNQGQLNLTLKAYF